MAGLPLRPLSMREWALALLCFAFGIVVLADVVVVTLGFLFGF